MTHNPTRDPQIEAYLRALAPRLRLDPAPRDRILDEVRAHLEDAARALEVEGVPPALAARRAVARFGEPAVIARQFAPSPLRFAAEAYFTFALLAAAGLIVIGLAGAIAGVVGLLAGPEAIAGAAPSRAWADHYYEESVVYQGAAGVAGVLLAIPQLLARRWLLGAGPRDRRWLAAGGRAATVSFGVATLVLSLIALDAVLDGAIFPTWTRVVVPHVVPAEAGAGLWLARALATAVAASVALVLVRYRDELPRLLAHR